MNQTTAKLLVQNGYNASNPLSPFKTDVPAGAPLLNVSAALTAMLMKGIAYVPPSSALLIGIIIAGVLVLLLGLVAWKKLLPPTTKGA
jgi:xanthine/uracil permease